MAVAATYVDTYTSTADGETFETPDIACQEGDVLAVGVLVAGSVANPVLTSDTGLTFVRSRTSKYDTSANAVHFYIADEAVEDAGNVKITVDVGETATAFEVSVYRLTGMERNGSAAVRQAAPASENRSGASDPDATFAQAALTGDPILIFIGVNAASDCGAPTGFTKDETVGVATPANTLVSYSKQSGFTGTLPTWSDHPGVGQEYGTVMVEIDATGVGRTITTDKFAIRVSEESDVQAADLTYPQPYPDARGATGYSSDEDQNLVWVTKNANGVLSDGTNEYVRSSPTSDIFVVDS